MALTLSRSAAARSYSIASDAASHVALDGLGDLLLATLEEQHHLVDVLAVGLLVDGLDAGALAALDVVQQAGPGERALAFLDIDGAGPEREQPTDEVHGLVHAAGRGVRPEVAAAVRGQLARPLDAREVVAQGDLDERVALVVLEPHVEARLVTLDQVRLQQQRLADGVGHRPLQVVDPVDGRLDAQRRGRGGAARLPVLADAVPEALRLAHVQHATLGVLHEVDAGAVGQPSSALAIWGVITLMVGARAGCQGPSRLRRGRAGAAAAPRYGEFGQPRRRLPVDPPGGSTDRWHAGKGSQRGRDIVGIVRTSCPT